MGLFRDPPFEWVLAQKPLLPTQRVLEVSLLFSGLLSQYLQSAAPFY